MSLYSNKFSLFQINILYEIYVSISNMLFIVEIIGTDIFSISYILRNFNFN